MIERTPEFLAYYPKAFGRLQGGAPDYSKCCKPVWHTHGFSYYQCTRANGHGPHGAYCKQHDPVARKARDAAKQNAAWKAKSLQSDFVTGCQSAIREIAAGHNDPRGLAQALIDKLEGRI